MALTVTEIERLSLGNVKGMVVDVDFDTSYPTGGEVLAAATFGLDTVLFTIIEPKAGYTFRYDRANGKLMAYVGDNDAVADGPGAQVADTTNLSAVTDVRVVALGW